MTKEKMVFARNRWEFARVVANSVTGKAQWERRDGSYICDVGDEIAQASVPPRPSLANLRND